MSAWEREQSAPPWSAVDRMCTNLKWPAAMFTEGGPAPSTFVNELIASGAASSEGAEKAIRSTPLTGAQAADFDYVQLLLGNRDGFVRYLQEMGPPLREVKAKLQFLGFVEEMANERGITIPKEDLEYIRTLTERGYL